MKVISGLDRLESAGISDTVATIGTFDGVHLGHKRIIEVMLEKSRTMNLRSTLVTFHPHPQMVLGKRGPMEVLTTLDEKLELLRATGIGMVIVLDFNRQLASYPPEDFVRKILIKRLGIKALVIGYDHCFGKDRAGNSALLEKMSKTDGFDFTVVPEFTADGRTVKSTVIRKELKSGDYRKARDILGYNYLISGKIIKGHGVGKTLGYPTINLAVPPVKLLPKDGVYAARARFDGSRFDGMAYIGGRLTFGDTALSVEVNLFDFSGRVESDEILLELKEFIRPPVKFETSVKLAEKMRSDEMEIKKRFG
jgi:riboflavin kinase/FMN adenylyltransferase